MGYRTRIGKVSKQEREQFKGKTRAEAEQIVAAIDPCSAIYRPPFHDEFCEVGRYHVFENNTDVEDFYDFDLEDEQFIIIGKNSLVSIIEEMRVAVAEHYTNIAAEIHAGKNLDYHAFQSLQRLSEWNNQYYHTLDFTDRSILTKSWLSEYAIFNLMFVYKTFDWDNDYLIFSGW